MTTGRKLAIGGAIVVAVTGMMGYVGASASWQYYLSVDECVSNGQDLQGDRIRVNGKIAPDSLSVEADRTQATFLLEGTEENLKVICSGPLPDNLVEGMDVVVEGRLEKDPALLRSHKVLTRCAGKYRSTGRQNRQPRGATAPSS